MDNLFTTAVDMVSSARAAYAAYQAEGGTDAFNVFFGKFRRDNTFRNTMPVQSLDIATMELTEDGQEVDISMPLPDLDDLEPSVDELAAIEAEEKVEPAKPAMPVLTTKEYQEVVKRGRGRPKGSKNKVKVDPVGKEPRVTKYAQILDFVKNNSEASLAVAQGHFSNSPANTVTVYFYRAKRELDNVQS